MAMTSNRALDRRSEDWRGHARCLSVTPDLFFPVGSKVEALEQIGAAKAVCRACPVRKECLEFALQTNQEDGIWGGTSEEERRKLRRGWRASRRALPKTG